MPTIGPYTLVSELGRGGMATVYRAVGPDSREVALKLLHPGLPPTLTQRFDRERRCA